MHQKLISIFEKWIRDQTLKPHELPAQEFVTSRLEAKTVIDWPVVQQWLESNQQVLSIDSFMYEIGRSIWDQREEDALLQLIAVVTSNTEKCRLGYCYLQQFEEWFALTNRKNGIGWFGFNVKPVLLQPQGSSAFVKGFCSRLFQPAKQGIRIPAEQVLGNHLQAQSGAEFKPEIILVRWNPFTALLQTLSLAVNKKRKIHALVQSILALERKNQTLETLVSGLQVQIINETAITQKLQATVSTRTIELEDTIHQLKEIDETKSYFLTITSHELRTPLTIIKGALNLLLTDGKSISPERYRKYLVMAKNNAEHLNLLITNLLDLSRLESGQLKLDIHQIDMNRLFQGSLEAFGDLAAKNDQEISLEIPKSLPRLYGDQGRLKQVIDNLISNAIKFTPKHGKIRIKVMVENEWVTIIFSDNGIGIAPWEKEKIFRKFQQADYSLTRETAGVGLGLAIVKDLVELHEGKIWVESEKERGSNFYISLPLAGPKDQSNFKLHQFNENDSQMLRGK